MKMDGKSVVLGTKSRGRVSATGSEFWVFPNRNAVYKAELPATPEAVTRERGQWRLLARAAAVYPAYCFSGHINMQLRHVLLRHPTTPGGRQQEGRRARPKKHVRELHPAGGVLCRSHDLTS